MSTAVVQPRSAPTTLSKATAVSKTKSPAPQLAVDTSNARTSTVKSKKAANGPAPPPSEKTHSQEQMKKVSRRTSRPIINWFQRKLAGTVRARRVSESQRYGAPSPRGKEKQQRRQSVPVPPTPGIQSRTRSNTVSSRQNKAHSLRGTISLNETNEDGDSPSYRSDSDDELHSSMARESLYSPASYLEADEDASVRPLPPSSPPSPSPSRDSSSYLSHSRTFRSMTASTKPTTLLSVDLTGGMAHIAQAPPTPTTPGHRLPPHIRTHSTGPSAGSITFSAFPFSAFPPPSPTSPSRPSSGNSGARGGTLTAPLYTSHHPRNNPRPSSPPPDDASMLTLASSAFGFPGARIGLAALTMSGRGSIADDSVSQWSNPAGGMTDSTSHFMMGDLEEGMEESYNYHDVDASVRALRPRSSRRGSWDSTVSGWSANVALGSAAGPSPGGARTKSMWTSGSLRTGGLSTDEAQEYGFSGGHGEGDGEAKEEDAGEVASSNQTHETVSSVQTDTPAPSSTTAEAQLDSTENVQASPDQAADVAASTQSLPGSKANSVPLEMASTASLAGSKAVSEVLPPDAPSVSGGETKSGASTPTLPEFGVESQAASTAMTSKDTTEEVRQGGEDHQTLPEEDVLSPASTVFVSAPSTPAAV